MTNQTPNAPSRRRGEAHTVLADKPLPARAAGNPNTGMGNFSRVTERAQTTLPKGVRNALGAGPGTTLSWVIHGNTAVVTVQEAEEIDPVVDAFLAFLEKDMIENPHRVSVLPADMFEKARQLTAGIVVNLDEPL